MTNDKPPVDVSPGMIAVGFQFIAERKIGTSYTEDGRRALVVAFYEAMELQRRAERKCAKCRKLASGGGHT